MIILTDGPAAGSYAVHRAPDYLRAVIIPSDGSRDVLDQITDTPRMTEVVHVYCRVTPVQYVHIRATRGSGVYAQATYHHMPDVDGQTLRDNDAWQSWAQSQPPATR